MVIFNNRGDLCTADTLCNVPDFTVCSSVLLHVREQKEKHDDTIGTLKIYYYIHNDILGRMIFLTKQYC
jgi:hypothetical protein